MRVLLAARALRDGHRRFTRAHRPVVLLNSAAGLWRHNRPGGRGNL